jgi:predicted acylesterase/phospholipase RssA
MRPRNVSIRRVTRRSPEWPENWIYRRYASDEFGDVTSLINALRRRALYQFSSLRLLNDLVDVMRGSQPQPAAAAGPRPAHGGGDQPAGVLDSDWRLVRRAALSSPCLFQGLNLGPGSRLRQLGTTPTMHRILLCQRDGLGAPVGELAALLAAAIARQFDEPAAVVQLADGRAHAELWVGRRALVLPDAARSFAELSGLLAQAAAARQPAANILHVVLAFPDRAGRFPAAFVPPASAIAGAARERRATAGFDRIVYLTDAMPARPPAPWVRLLTPAARWREPQRPDREGPYFCSFVTTLVRTPVPTGGGLESRPADGEFDLQRRRDAHWRLDRDRCLLPFAELDALRARLADADARELAERWARAVTNRQVGMALSGGGALSYRLVPLIKGIRQRRVPIDVVSGVSGGALIAAYYCAHGVEGLDRCLALGRRMGPLLLARACIRPGTFEKLVDGDLGRIDVASLSTRFVPLATAIVDDVPPAAHVVVRGTLGQAVQVSGAAPVLFAPTVHMNGSREVHFADGATSAFIPARVLRDAGADLVLAFNCLAGPSDGNPLGWVGRLPLVDRLCDLWVSGSYLAQRIGREVDEDAHVYFEPDEEARPLLDSVHFPDGAAIAEDSARTARVSRCIRDCVEVWTRFKRNTQ